MKWHKAWPEDKQVRSKWGKRTDPITAKPKTMHRGWDIGGQFEVVAVGDGIFHKKGYNSTGGGHWAKIYHPEADLFSVYYHGAHASDLEPGDLVEGGKTVVYLSGSTGKSTGNHLHLEFRKGPNTPGGSNDGKWGTDIDPALIYAATDDKRLVLSTGRFDRPTIAHLQQRMTEDGFPCGSIDGVIGPKTIKAMHQWLGLEYSYARMTPTLVRALQKRVGSKTDGILGPKTAFALQEYLAKAKYGQL